MSDISPKFHEIVDETFNEKFHEIFMKANFHEIIHRSIGDKEADDFLKVIIQMCTLKVNKTVFGGSVSPSLT